MNTARKGSSNEQRSKRWLEAAGYVATRAAASKGPFDLIGLRGDSVALCQVKSSRWPSPAERAALAAVEVPAVCRKIVHRWRDRQREPDVMELAAK